MVAFTQQLTQFIRQLVPQMSDLELQAFCEKVVLRSLKKSEYFVRCGEKSGEVAFVIQGVFKQFYVDHDNREYIRNFNTEFSPIAAYASLITGEASDISIQALLDAKIFSIPYQSLLELYEGFPTWQKFGRLMAERQLLVRGRRERQFLLDDARSRYRSFLSEFPGLESRIPAYEVASFLGINAVTLSRIKSQLGKA